MKKNVIVKKSILLDITISFLISYFLVFFLQHFRGKITYLPNVPVNEYVTYKSPVYQIYFDTAFGNKLTYSGEGYLVSDINLNISEKSLHKFSNKLPYYFKASIKDFFYVILFSCLFAFIINIFRNYKIKIE